MEGLFSVRADRHWAGALHLDLAFQRFAAGLFAVDVEGDLFAVVGPSHVMPVAVAERFGVDRGAELFIAA